MSGRADKKLRQLFRKEQRKTAREIAAMYSQLIKPKPKWCPSFVYLWVLRLVLKV